MTTITITPDMEKVFVKVIIKDAPKMTHSELIDIKKWLKKTGDYVVKNQKELSNKFIARYVRLKKP